MQQSPISLGGNWAASDDVKAALRWVQSWPQQHSADQAATSLAGVGTVVQAKALAASNGSPAGSQIIATSTPTRCAVLSPG